jgi:enoyl-CoA hydratase
MAVVVEDRHSIRLVTLDRPPVNALDVDTLRELTNVLEAAAADGDINGVVLTGAGKVMSAGADLTKVLQAGDDYIDAGIDALNRAFRTLFIFPKPVVAAVNGHALAGGAVLVCGCDHRVMGAGAGRIGVIELAAGVPFPAWALQLVSHRVHSGYLEEVVLFGRAYEPEVAHRYGLIDEVVDDGAIVDVALDRAGELAQVPSRTFMLTKRSLRAAAVANAEALAAHDNEIKEAWRSPEVRAAIQLQMASLRGSAAPG